MKIFKKLLCLSFVFITCESNTQNSPLSDDSQEAIIESLLHTSYGQEVIKYLDQVATEESTRMALEETRPVATTNTATQVNNNNVNLKIRTELIRQEILTMNIMKVFAVTASIASIAAGSYIFLLLFNK